MKIYSILLLCLSMIPCLVYAADSSISPPSVSMAGVPEPPVCTFATQRLTWKNGAWLCAARTGAAASGSPTSLIADFGGPGLVCPTGTNKYHVINGGGSYEATIRNGFPFYYCTSATHRYYPP